MRGDHGSGHAGDGESTSPVAGKAARRIAFYGGSFTGMARGRRSCSEWPERYRRGCGSSFESPRPETSKGLVDAENFGGEGREIGASHGRRGLRKWRADTRGGRPKGRRDSERKGFETASNSWRASGENGKNSRSWRRDPHRAGHRPHPPVLVFGPELALPLRDRGFRHELEEASSWCKCNRGDSRGKK